MTNWDAPGARALRRKTLASIDARVRSGRRNDPIKGFEASYAQAWERAYGREFPGLAVDVNEETHR